MANRKTFNSVIGDLINTKRAAWCPFVSRVSIFGTRASQTRASGVRG